MEHRTWNIDKTKTINALRSMFYGHQESGQALIMLVAFAAIAVVVISSAVLGTVINSTSTSKTQEGEIAMDIAESGVENALIRLLRDSNYSGETLTVGSGSATITVTGSNPKTILSTGAVGKFKRTIQAIASDSAGILSVTSWKEL